MPASFVKFKRFTKFEEDENGKPIVYGLATFEQPDLDREICRYSTAVKVYRAWSDAAAKRTTHAGQEVSLGNVRLQHGLPVGGKVVKIDFDDENKSIFLGSRPVNKEIHDQLKQGYYTGYSQGGSYASRECAVCGAAMPMAQGANFCRKCGKEVDVVYDLESLSEVSYVDSPCTAEGFEYVKSNGSKSLIKFQSKGAQPMPKENAVELASTQLDLLADLIVQKSVTAKAKEEAKTKRVGGKDLPADCFAYIGDPEKTETWKLPIKSPDNDVEWEKRHIRNALARFEQTKGIPEDEKAKVKAKIDAAAKKHDIDVAEDAEKTAKLRANLTAIVDKRAEAKGLKKSMYSVGRFAEIIQSLEYLYMDTMWEAENEGDESEVPEDLSEDMESLIETFLAMCQEETQELTAAHKGAGIPNNKENNMSEDLMKAAKKLLARHFGKAAAHHTKLAKCHMAKAEEHDGLEEVHKKHAELHEEACKSHKAAGEADGVLPEHEEHHKAMAEHHAEKAKLHKKAAEHHKVLAEHCRKIAKAHEEHAEHCKAMAEEHDKEEAEKAFKEAGAADPNPVVKTAPVAAAPQVSEFERDAVAKAQESLLKDPDFMEEVKNRQREMLLTKLASAGAQVALENTPEPTATKTTSPTAVARTGQTFEFAKEAPETSDGIGL